MSASTVLDERWIDEAVKILRRADRLCPPAKLTAGPPSATCAAARHRRANLLRLEKKYAHLGERDSADCGRWKEENARLKRLVADLSLDKHMLSGAPKKSEARTPSRTGPLVS